MPRGVQRAALAPWCVRSADRRRLPEDRVFWGRSRAGCNVNVLVLHRLRAECRHSRHSGSIGTVGTGTTDDMYAIRL